MARTDIGVQFTLHSINRAAAEVLNERKRQVEAEGWTPEHDDKHDDGDLAIAAACYALSAGGFASDARWSYWPWDVQWWKPDGARRDLVRAGALILAEIERLDRAAACGNPNCFPVDGNGSPVPDDLAARGPNLTYKD